MDSCAANGTVVATVATSWEAARVRALAASVARAGFGCLVVQSNAPQPQMAGQHVVLLPPPVPALVPRRRWCRRQALYARRLRELHQALLWRIVLDSRLDLLAVDTELVLVSSPLPHLHSLATHGVATPDVVGTRRTWDLRHDLLWVRSTAATREVAARAESRTWGTSFAFAEELSYGEANASCCNTQCLRRFVRTNPFTDAGAAGAKIGRCQDETGPVARRAAASPPRSRLRWRGTWHPSRFNPVASTDRLAKCTWPRSGCFWRAPAEPAAPQAKQPWQWYPAERMYGTAAAFTSPCIQFLRGIEPTVLQLEGSVSAGSLESICPRSSAPDCVAAHLCGRPRPKGAISSATIWACLRRARSTSAPPSGRFASSIRRWSRLRAYVAAT